MDEKTMVNDILSCAKSSLSLYQMGIAETENLQLRQVLQQLRDDTESFQYELFKVAKSNLQLRQVLQQLRDDTESFQYELFKVAKSKGYYKPAAPADSSEIQTVKTELESC